MTAPLLHVGDATVWPSIWGGHVVDFGDGPRHFPDRRAAYAEARRAFQKLRADTSPVARNGARTGRAGPPRVAFRFGHHLLLRAASWGGRRGGVRGGGGRGGRRPRRELPQHLRRKSAHRLRPGERSTTAITTDLFEGGHRP